MKNLSSNLLALEELRNAVMHNKLLILYRGYKICYLENDVRSSTLKSNIINAMNFLTKGVKEKYVEEINKCAYNNNNSKNEIEWDLPEYLIIKIDL